LSTAPHATAFHTLSLHDALPICRWRSFTPKRSPVRSQYRPRSERPCPSSDVALWSASSPVRTHLGTPTGSDGLLCGTAGAQPAQDRKSTRLNSSHVKISYAVFCL